MRAYLYLIWLCTRYIIDRVLNRPIVTSLFDLDLYKLTMLVVAQLGKYSHNGKEINFKDVVVTYRLKNRNKKKLVELIPYRLLKKQLDHVLKLRITKKQINYLRSLGIFPEELLQTLPSLRLSSYDLRIENGEYVLTITGNWPKSILHETIDMCILTELAGWCQIVRERRNPYAVWLEGNRRLEDKIQKLKTRINLRFADFGSRRRYSKLWQMFVIWRLRRSLPKIFVGSSNVQFSMQFGTTPIGTFAHEKYMILYGILKYLGDNPRKVHNLVLDIWREFFEGKLLGGRDILIALTDAFGTDAFLKDISEENLKKFGVRHDSNDPRAFAYKMISHWVSHGIDTNKMRIVFSDGLDVDTIIALHDEFSPLVIDLYGWGTDLMNDLGLNALNIVIKAVVAMEIDLVKLSDVKGKFTGKPEAIELAIEEFEYGVPELVV